MATNKTDVAHTLADALQKIEHILSDDRNQGHLLSDEAFNIDDDNSADLPLKIRNYVYELRCCVERLEPSQNLDNVLNIPLDTVNVLVEWLHQLQPVLVGAQVSNGEKPIMNHNPSEDLLEKKLLRLENEKESFLLQVGVLTDQVEVQGEKMRELELLRDELQMKLTHLEETVKKARADVAIFKHKNDFLNNLVSELKSTNKTPEQDDGISKHNNMENDIKHELAKKNLEIEDFQRIHLETFLDEEEREKRLSASSDSGNSFGIKLQLREKASEVSRLKIKVEKLTSMLNEKESCIEDLERQLHVATTKLTITNGDVTKNEDAESVSSASVASDVFADQNKKHNPKNATESALSNGDEMPGDTTCLLLSNNAEVRRAVEITSSSANKPEQQPENEPSLKRENKTRSSFSKGLRRSLKLKRNRSISEPTLSPSEKIPSEASKHKTTDYHDDHNEKGKKRSIVGKVFEKLRRSNSQGLDSDIKDHNATGTFRKLYADVPFSSWSSDMLMRWLEEEGLGQYTEICSNFVKCGDDLVKMSSADLEKVLGMRKPLHRKKLHLALQAVTEAHEDVMDQLDNSWVLDWLEDIGLPQYKDSFRENLVDGRMLNYLTVSDVLQLKVYSTFHQHSLRRAIQCLRVYNFHPNYLKKSPIDESWQQGAHVVLWTNHRVTEWLRQADLSEYATNLRGSGVHGSLMILEPRFTAESMATILSIPSGKKLLRRHLATHFDSLIGVECMKVKERAVSNGFAPLLPGEKHKARKISIGGIRRRSKSDSECEEYVCPMDTEIPVPLQKIFSPRPRKVEGHVAAPGHMTGGKIRAPEQQADDELTKTLGTFSKELNSLTDMLGHDDSSER